ncbi:uncharacterized protein LOC142646407 [Dermatophagoides pteronyssinus]|uniref:28S ribosomal protein S36, mitochondrial-like n=1 Tax=Dermatophagoides pteronyssinus TaxID=6956 RepID=A0ABQ8IRV6_DERPT|nr:hypothetical protein DERP_006748 [Dermatophagoides pteronyssinus]
MSSVAKAWKVIKPHVPLIQFKKGGRLTNNQKTHGSTASNTKILIDDTQLPARYQRKPMTELEMQLIENGGVPL